MFDSRLRLLSPGAGLLLIPLLLGCQAGGEEPRAEAAPPDSALVSILESAAGNPPSSSLPGSPRLTPQERAGRPLDIASMGFNDGSPEAPVKVLELSDFGCGYCKVFHLETFAKIREIYVETGLVEWKYVPTSVGFPNGFQAAMAAECAGEQDRFPAMRTRLFTDQAQWRNTQDPYRLFSQMAGEEGLDVDRFQACIEGGWREARVRDNLRLTGELKVQGTPTFVLDGNVLPGAQPLALWRDVLDVSLRSKGVEPPKR